MTTISILLLSCQQWVGQAIGGQCFYRPVLYILKKAGIILILIGILTDVAAQRLPKQRISLGVYPLHIQPEGRNAFYMANLSYDYRLKNRLALGAFATYTRWGTPSVQETVVGPRVSYLYEENRLAIRVGGGPGYGWVTGASTVPDPTLRLKYQIGFSYRLLGATGVYAELSNYRSVSPVRFGFWPMIGLTTQF